MEPRKKSDRPTPLETEVMNALWETSPATAQTVRRLGRGLAYATAQTMLNVLESRRLAPGKLARLHRMLKAKEARHGND
jgi:predicted transcriptional regulator